MSTNKILSCNWHIDINFMMDEIVDTNGNGHMCKMNYMDELWHR
jgi:hypothetical protein